MKKFLPIVFFLCSFSLINAQTATSVTNGNWLNPLTWDCLCVPLPGYSVTINHDVILDTDFACSAGFIVINSGGSLVQNTNNRNLWVYGNSYVSNFGTLTVQNFLYEGTASVLTNTGTITNGNLFLTTGMYNAGDVIADSLYNNDTLANTGTITVNAFTNAVNCYNVGDINFHDFSNIGHFINSEGVLTGTHNMWNQGFFVNVTASMVFLENDLLNTNLLTEDAHIFNDGWIIAGNGFYNFDTISGYIGYYQVADTSFNDGYFYGTFDFCDLTPPANAPFIDINTGIIDPNITWCIQQNVPQFVSEMVTIYPNPADDYLEFNIDTENAYLRIYDYTGKMIKSSFVETSTGIIRTEDLLPGLYYLEVETPDSRQLKKIVIQR